MQVDSYILRIIEKNIFLFIKLLKYKNTNISKVTYWFFSQLILDNI